MHTTAAVALDGSLAVVYLPTPRGIAVDLDRMTGWVTRVRWFAAESGSWVGGGVVTRRGILQLTPPGDGDCALVLDDPAAGHHGAWAVDR